MTWTQPICERCYRHRHPDRMPARVLDADAERCAWCGRMTGSGIYVRANPITVPYPREEH